MDPSISQNGNGRWLMDHMTVVKEIGSWPVENRLRLIEEVWDGITATPEAVALSEAQKHELQRRLDAYRDNPQTGSPWDEVKARLQGGVR